MMAEATTEVKMDQPFASKPLAEEDITTLLDLLIEVTHKWELIATYLKLSSGAVAIIKTKVTEPENKLLEVVKRWLTRTNPAPTVMTLVDVLRKPIIGEEKVALQIEKHFYPNSQVCLQKSMSTSEAQSLAFHTQEHVLDRSESSPAAVSMPSARAAQHDTSTQVITPEHDSLHKEKSQQNPDTVLETSTILLDSLDIEHRSSYKYLDLEKMTDLEQRTLKGRLTNDYKRITCFHSELNQHVIQSLKDRAITPKQLSRVLMNLCAFRVQKHDVRPLLADNLDNIRDAEEVDDVFYILRSYGSFFDCHVIKHIVNSNLCTDGDRDELAKYEKELDTYCQRSVFECPHIENPDPNFQSFVMKVDDVVLKSSEMKAIDAFRVKLAEACGLEGHTLRLCSVEMGCLQLTFQIPPFVADSLFPLTDELKIALRDLGILNLTCSEHSLVFHSDSSQSQQTKVSGCAWHKLLGRCNYGDNCRYEHDIIPITNPVVGSVPEGASLEAVKQIPPSGYTNDGKAYIIAISPGPKEEMKIIAEDKPTLEFAQAEVCRQLQSTKSALSTRLKYSYIHPDGIELPVLYVFKKRECINEYELQNIRPKVQVKKTAVETFDHMTRKHVTPAYSRLYRHKKNVYPVQLRRDFREDICEQLRQGLGWMHENGLTPQLEGRFGKFTWRECLDDECFDVEKLMSFTNEGGKLKYYTFNTKVDGNDVTAVKKMCHKQISFKEETYTFVLKDTQGSEESYRVQIKFDATGQQRIVYTRKMVAGVAKVQVLLDILFLHRKYDTRVSLCSVEKVDNPSVRHFISSAIQMPEPGVIHYDPTASQEKWCVSYIRHQKSDKYLKDPYTVDISTVGQYQIDVGDIKQHKLRPMGFTRRHEVELHCDSWASLDAPWTPDIVMSEFENGRFLQIMEDLNRTMYS